MAEELKDAFDVESELIEGRGGVFDVTVDGKLVYSKQKTGVFPEHDALIKQIEALGKP